MSGDRFPDLWQLSPLSPELRRMATFHLPVAQPAAGAPAVYKVPNDWWERVLAVTATLTTSAALPQRQPLLQVVNADGTVLAQVPVGPTVGPSYAWPLFAGIDLPARDTASGPTRANTGSQTAPAALTAIATLTPGAGLWTASAVLQLTGTPGAGELNNFGLYAGATQVAQYVNQGAIFGPFAYPPTVVRVPAATAIAIQNVGVGTAGAIYSAQLQLAPYLLGAGAGKMPQVILKPGWSVQLTATSLDVADQLSAVVVTTERYPSVWADGQLKATERDKLHDIWQAVVQGR